MAKIFRGKVFKSENVMILDGANGRDNHMQALPRTNLQLYLHRLFCRANRKDFT